MLTFPQLKKIQIFFNLSNRALQEATKITLSGEKLADGTLEKPLTTHFEILNLVPTQQKPIIKKENTENHQQIYKNKISGSTKWRRVGLVSGTSVQLDTIVWPGGDIVVSGIYRFFAYLFLHFINI